MTTHRTITRRTALLSSASALVALAGCSEDSPESNGDPGSEDGPITNVAIEETELVVEFDPEAGAETLSVVDPTGESVDVHDLAPGVSRESVALGTSYEPGVFDIRLVDGDETVDAVEYEIRPELSVVDLKLGRNHPEEMYDGAGDLESDAEAILSLENTGSGPEEVGRIQFAGDVPQPTPEDYEGSGFHIPAEEDTQAGRSIPGGSSVTVYSDSRPFSPTGGNIDCSEGEMHGNFEITLQTSVSGDLVYSYSVTYRPDDDVCAILVEAEDHQ